MKKIVSILSVLTITLSLLVSCANDDKAVSQSTPDITEVTQATEATTNSAVDSESGGNMLSNGDFSSGNTDSWFVFTSAGTGTISVVDGEMEVDVVKSGVHDYSVQVYQDGFGLDLGCVYRITFDARSTLDRTFELRAQLNGGDYHAYVSEILNLSAEMQSYSVEFTMSEESDPAPRFAINLGTPKDISDSLESHKVYFDNFVFECIDSSGKIDVADAVVSVDVNLNQLGYRPDDKKIAVFRKYTGDKTFDVIDVASGQTVFTGDIAGRVLNMTANETNCYGDFSSVTTPGKYIVRTASLGDSFEFEIGNDVYNDAFADVIKMLYMQRCGVELTSQYAGDYAHAACHTELATVYGTSDKIDVSGGWHDAGDYGRYVVPGAKTVADLILSYQLNPSVFGDNLGIPESGNGVPDILDETRYELEWMLKMQASSGGVYHKVTCANFPGMVMPEDETEELIVSPVSDAATGDFAAVMAMSYNVYKDYDKTFADKCLNASKKAWTYLSSKGTLTGFTNPSGVVTGEYGDSNISDEVFWAAAELFKATGSTEYKDYIKSNYSNKMKDYGWADVGGYGVYAYLTTDSTKTDKSIVSLMMADFLAYADELLSISMADGYMISLTVYPWGSNMSVANNAMHLILAERMSSSNDYIEYAKAHMDYIFGANPTSYCYVTGFGTLSPDHTHHRPSEALGNTMAGMLVGGPNQNLEDPYAQAVLKNEAPAKCYADNAQSYSCNEITIYWNSPLIFVMSSIIN